MPNMQILARGGHYDGDLRLAATEVGAYIMYDGQAIGPSARYQVTDEIVETDLGPAHVAVFRYAA
jgi:hypothetical protein